MTAQSTASVDLGKSRCRVVIHDATRIECSGTGAPGLAAAGGVDAALDAILPLLAAWFALALVMPADAALHGVLGNWPYLGQAISGDAFYARSAGLDAPLRQRVGAEERATEACVFVRHPSRPSTSHPCPGAGAAP